MPTHVYSGSGTHDVTLTVTDDDSNTSQLTRKVTSTDTGLVARFRTKKDESSNLKIWFNGEYSHDAAGADVAYWAWSFGDGGVAEEGVPPGGYGDNAYWVSPTGAATWANAKSSEPLSGTACCSLSTANSNITAGKIAYLRGGNYNVATYRIVPVRSGTLGSRITYKATPGEYPTFMSTGSNNDAIRISSQSYIVIDGIIGAASLQRWIRLDSYDANCSYNEIKNCSFIATAAGSANYVNGFLLWDSPSGSYGCTHNWIHHNTMAYYGLPDAYDLLSIDMAMASDSRGASNYNTVEDNSFYYGGHTVIVTFSHYNVIKNNWVHNEGWLDPEGGETYGPDSNGKYANRCICIDDYKHGTGTGSYTYSLVEGNRIGAAGSPTNTDGGDGLTFVSQRNIARFNDIINSQNNGIFMKVLGSYGNNNRIYNNTIAWNGRWKNAWLPSDSQWQGYGLRYTNWGGTITGNTAKNNIFYGNGAGGPNWDGWPAARDVLNNGSNTLTNNWLNASGDPLFTDSTHADLASSTVPDLTLQSSSPCKNGGTYLTQANGAGSGSSTLIVDDALYFQDGTWGSELARGVTLFPDWISIGTVDNVAQISAVNYDTNTITLASPMTWADNANIWLYKDSDGTRILYGSAPDYGAHPYGG